MDKKRLLNLNLNHSCKTETGEPEDKIVKSQPHCTRTFIRLAAKFCNYTSRMPSTVNVSQPPVHMYPVQPKLIKLHKSIKIITVDRGTDPVPIALIASNKGSCA